MNWRLPADFLPQPYQQEFCHPRTLGPLGSNLPRINRQTGAYVEQSLMQAKDSLRDVDWICLKSCGLWGGIFFAMLLLRTPRIYQADDELPIR